MSKRNRFLVPLIVTVFLPTVSIGHGFGAFATIQAASSTSLAFIDNVARNDSGMTGGADATPNTQGQPEDLFNRGWSPSPQTLDILLALGLVASASLIAYSQRNRIMKNIGAKTKTKNKKR